MFSKANPNPTTEVTQSHGDTASRTALIGANSDACFNFSSALGTDGADGNGTSACPTPAPPALRARILPAALQTSLCASS